jgi:hypothetical protein
MTHPVHRAWRHLTRLPETLVREVQWAHLEILGFGAGLQRALDLEEREAERRAWPHATGRDAEWEERRS